MPNPLMSCGKIVKTGHKIILDDPIATAINKLTNEVVMEAEFDPRTSMGNVYRDGPIPYEFNEKKREKTTWIRSTKTTKRGMYHPSS